MPSMISDLIDASMDDTGEIKDEEFIAGMAGNVYIGGLWNGKSITGINPTPRDMSDFYSLRPLPQGLLICVFAMLMNPDAQSRAQTEIDSVTGGKRLPHFDDREKLPYVQAILEECFRYCFRKLSCWI